MACGGYGSHRPTGPATSQGFDPSRGDPKKPSVFMCRLLSYTFSVNILILKRYHKVFILFFQYYIFIIFFNKNNEIIKTNDLTRKRVEEQGSRKKRENKHET